MSGEAKSLGQVAEEARCASEGWDSHWGIMSAESRACWERTADAIKAALVGAGREERLVLGPHLGYRWRVTGNEGAWIAEEVRDGDA